MKSLYDISVGVASGAATLFAKAIDTLTNGECKSKTAQFCQMQRDVFDKLNAALVDNGWRDASTSGPAYWFHASSLGEYAVARPLMRALKEANHGCRILLSFFSPTGVNALKGAATLPCDIVMPMPLDTPGNAARFLDLVKPDRAVFMVSELWPNYMSELTRRGIPSFLISYVAKPGTALRKPWGGLLRDVVKGFTACTALDDNSAAVLLEAGARSVTVCGNPALDNAIEVSRMDYRNDVVERFVKAAGGAGVFIAGSVSDRRDTEMIADLANDNPGMRFIVVPHEISEERLNTLRMHFKGNSALYSECDADSDFTSIQVLVIDFVGALARLYRYGRWAYVGGGFTRLLHSVIEPAAYGLPVSFGPRVERQAAPRHLIDIGVGTIVENSAALARWFAAVKDDDDKLALIKRLALDYVSHQSGATARVVEIIR